MVGDGGGVGTWLDFARIIVHLATLLSPFSSYLRLFHFRQNIGWRNFEVKST